MSMFTRIPKQTIAPGACFHMHVHELTHCSQVSFCTIACIYYFGINLTFNMLSISCLNAIPCSPMRSRYLQHMGSCVCLCGDAYTQTSKAHNYMFTACIYMMHAATGTHRGFGLRLCLANAASNMICFYMARRFGAALKYVSLYACLKYAFISFNICVCINACYEQRRVLCLARCIFYTRKTPCLNSR